MAVKSNFTFWNYFLAMYFSKKQRFMKYQANIKKTKVFASKKGTEVQRLV
jgi:hypothetical protein